LSKHPSSPRLDGGKSRTVSTGTLLSLSLSLLPSFLPLSLSLSLSLSLFLFLSRVLFREGDEIAV